MIGKPFWPCKLDMRCFHGLFVGFSRLSGFYTVVESVNVHSLVIMLTSLAS
jgi:hypothetical protein